MGSEGSIQQIPRAKTTQSINKLLAMLLAAMESLANETQQESIASYASAISLPLVHQKGEAKTLESEHRTHAKKKLTNCTFHLPFIQSNQCK